MIQLKKIIHKGEARILIQAPYNESLNAKIKQLTGSRFSASRKSWHLPRSLQAVEQLRAACAETFPIHTEALHIQQALLRTDYPEASLYLQFSSSCEAAWKEQLRTVFEARYLNNTKEWQIPLRAHTQEELQQYFDRELVEICEAKEKPAYHKAALLSKNEIESLLQTVKNEKHRTLLAFMYACGLRRHEVTQIELQHLHSQNKTLRIVDQEGNTLRTLPLSPKLMELVIRYYQNFKPQTYLFESKPGVAYSNDSVYRIFKKALQQAGIDKHVGVHALRQSYASHLLDAGTDAEQMQALLGHKSARTTQAYGQIKKPASRQVNDPLADFSLDSCILPTFLSRTAKP